MRKTVLYREGHTWRNRKVSNARRARIPGVRYFKCFTNRWWSPRMAVHGAHRYIVSEVTTGFTPNAFSCASRREAIAYARVNLTKRPRRVILGAIARIKAGHIVNVRFPQHLKFRTR